MRSLAVLTACSFLLVGCAGESSLQRTTAELTGCSEEDVQISDVQRSGANSWKAICRNNAKIYSCNSKECTEIK